VTGAEAALPYVLAAADHAMARLAYEQAEQQLRRALRLLASLPVSAERTRRELGVQVRLGSLLGQLHGPGGPEAAAVFERAAELAAEAADDPAALPALAGVHEGYIVRAEFDRARTLAERVLGIAQRTGDPLALLAWHFLLGHTMSAQGELTAARDHLEEVRRLAAGLPEAARPAGIPMALAAAGVLEVVLLLLGRHDQADEVAAAAGRELPHAPHPYPKAGTMTARVYAAVHRRDPALLRARAAATEALCQRWGFEMLAASATAPLGWAQAIEGDPAGGASLLRHALARWRATGSQASAPLLLGLLAEAEQLAGRPEEALRLLDEALAQAGRSGERYFDAELHRLRGESLLAVSPSRAAEAEAALTTALAMAGRQGAKLLEDRATVSLGRAQAIRRPQSSR
jgi:tetratricopeptide (TPR) repeat protein